jgi:hypothetical protein
MKLTGAARICLALCALAPASAHARAQDAAPPAQEPPRPEIEVVRNREVPETMTQEEARAVLDRSLAYLVRAQKPDGSWSSVVPEHFIESAFSVETFHAWQVAADALACLALLEAPETPERRAALEKGLAWLCSVEMPKRGSDWDNDAVWPGVYGFVTCVRAYRDPRLANPVWRSKLEARGREFLDLLERNQIPTGGWAYYDDPPFSQRPKWATSFCTASVLPLLAEGERLGWLTDPKIRARATEYVRRCSLPNGAYEYDLNPIPRMRGGENINNVKGSLGRIQVCNWALASVGVKSVTPDKLREGLAAFFEHHRFLDVARMRPIPHEGYYQNAGYFYFFGHYYAANAINLLPEGEREALHARLRPHLAKTQRTDGSCCDFLGTSREVTACTAFFCLSLTLGLPRAAAN